MSRRWLAVAVALGLAGCHGSVITLADVEPNYSITELGYGSSLTDGTIPVLVHGDSFAMDHQAFAAAVAQAMPTAIGARVSFRAAPTVTKRPDYYVVWNFGPLANGTKFEVCRSSDAPAPTTAPSGPVTVYAGFCRLGSPLSTAYGTVTATGVDTPGFQELIQQITFTLFPPTSNMMMFGMR